MKQRSHPQNPHSMVRITYMTLFTFGGLDFTISISLCTRFVIVLFHMLCEKVNVLDAGFACLRKFDSARLLRTNAPRSSRKRPNLAMASLQCSLAVGRN